MVVKARGLGQLIVMPLTDKTLRVEFPYNKTLVAEVKAMEGATWHGYHGPDCPICKGGAKYWTVSDCKRNIFAFNQLESPGIPRYDAAISFLGSPVPKQDMREHQDNIYFNEYGRKRIIVAGDPGVGKTLPTLELINAVGGRWLVVAPKTVRNVWIAEARKWGFDHLLTEWRGGVGLKIISYHGLADFVARIPVDELRKIVGVVNDEAHNLKNPKAKRTEAALILSELLPDAYWINMTGTPSPRDPTDWWTLTELCCQGFLRESSPTKLRQRLGIFEESEDGDYKRLTGWNKDEVSLLYQRLKGMVLIIRKDDCLDLPEKIYDPLILEPDAATLKLAKFIASTAVNGLVALSRLRQFADGFQYGDGTEEPKPWPTPKDDALRGDLDDLAGNERNRVVIFAGFEASCDKCVAIALEKKWHIVRVDGRGTAVFHRDGYQFTPAKDPINDWFADEKVVDNIAYIGQPEAGGVGQNLQIADTAIFYSNSFKGAARMQAEDRIHRLGQTRKTRIRDYLYLPTDHKVLANLQLKKDLQELTLGQVLESFNVYVTGETSAKT